MHILVTDRLACSRCGPRFGLILLADELTDRRVVRGSLGCPNCRERYPIEAGFGDLRPSPRGDHETRNVSSPEASDPEGALRLAAFLGVDQGPGMVLLSGAPARHAERLAAMIEEIEVVADHPGLRAMPERPGVSRIVMGSPFPFQSGSLRGVALAGEEGVRVLDEAIRLLGPRARLVLLDPPPDSRRALEDRGLEVLLEARPAVVGARK